MRLPMLVFSVITLVMILGISPEQCKAGPITTAYMESQEKFSASVIGEGLVVNDTHMLVLTAGSWRVSINITENAGLTDVLSIEGMAQHLEGPHREGVNPGMFSFNLMVEADDFKPPDGFIMGSHALPVVFTIINHDQHFDVFRAMLSFTTLNVNGFDDIASYRLDVTGEHVIPEPATMLLLGTGLAGVAIKTRKRFKKPKGQH